MKDMVGYEERYAITEDGQVWSKLSKKFLSLHKTSRGYLTFATKIGGRNGTNKCFKIHRLVAEAYIANPDNKPYVNHKDGNKENNSVRNLEWVTNEENMSHAILNGLIHRGEDHKYSSLKNSDIEYIRSHYKPRDRAFGGKALADKLGVSPQVIYKIVQGKTYKET